MERIPRQEIEERYNSLKEIWSDSDEWHKYTKNKIADFVDYVQLILSPQDFSCILNAGSAGYSYGLDEKSVLHIDLAESKIGHLSNAIVGDLHKIPIVDGYFSLVLCVGSVINYCDPVLVISELSRVTKRGGFIVVEFENSKTLELIGTSLFNRKAILRNTFYNGQNEKLWYFSESFIKYLARLYGCEIRVVSRWHMLSPLIYRITKNERFAAKFKILDNLSSMVPWLSTCSSNVAILFRKK